VRERGAVGGYGLQQRQGEVAHGGGEAQALTTGPSPDIGRGEQLYRICSFYAQTHGAQVGAGVGHQALHHLAALAGNLQVNAGVKIYIAHATPHRHVGAPFLWGVAKEVGDNNVQAVEGLNAGVRVGAGEGQFEVDTMTT
jgi:hypothetical protein